MHDPIVPWLARRPALLDSAGAPVLPALPPILLVDHDPARAGRLTTLLVALAAEKPQLLPVVHDPPTRHGPSLQTRRSS